MVVENGVASTAKTRKKEAADAACIEEYNLKTEDYKRKISKRRSIFDLRTEAMRTDKGKPRQGRLYNEVHGAKEGGLKVDEMIYGIKMAHLSCTDDSEERLVGSSPNALAALEHAVGGPTPEITMRKPLSEILKERYDLNLDCWMNYSGFVKGRPIDTQGFIASNDETIVLSYRFSTTLYDWIANLSLTSSEWMIDKDEDRGHAGRWSSCGGWFTKMCRPSKSRPRVHTAYYNNFIYTIPMIRKHIIEPLLKQVESGEPVKPKKIFVVGCSLGAAVSQIAYFFILEELYEKLKDPDFKAVERLISVTAGSPRIGDRKFRDHIQKKMSTLRKLDRAVICRIVYNVDVVPHGPPHILGFRHVDKLVYITKGGRNFIVNPDLSKHFSSWEEFRVIGRTVMVKKKQDVDKKAKEIVKATESFGKQAMARASMFVKEGPSSLTMTSEDIRKNEVKTIEKGIVSEDVKEDFAKECEEALEVIHDHMPYWYMTYLEKLKEEQDALYKTKEKIETVAEA